MGTISYYVEINKKNKGMNNYNVFAGHVYGIITDFFNILRYYI